MKYAICGLILALSLTGCGAASFEKNARELVAPDVVAYSHEQMSAAADELEKYDVPQLTEMMKDYCVMRDQSRVLKGQKKLCTANE